MNGVARRILAGMALICVAACTGPSAPDDGDRPDIVFVLIDTLRADALGAYGNTRGPSPTIDAIGAEGVLFERAIAQSPWTQPSMASLEVRTKRAMSVVSRRGEDTF